MVKRTREDPKNLKEFVDGLIIEKLKGELLTKETKSQWLRNAVSHVKDIRLATHAPKFTHSSASGATSIYYNANCDEDRPMVGTHSIGKPLIDLHVLNAIGLGIGTFLTAKFSGKSIFEYAVERSPELLEALSDNREEAEWLISSFLEIQQYDKPASHTFMKQIFFPLDGGGYHLLSPLFPTSLVHEVHERIVKNKNAKWENSEHLEFVKVVTTSYGGANPRNVSMLNLRKRGKHMLLASFPPTWKTQNVRPINDTSVFKYRFPRRFQVKELLKALKPLIEHPYKNANIKRGIGNIIDGLINELVILYYEMQEVVPGWSNEKQCKLDEYEKSWLDPLTDEYEDAWCSEVASSFANWLSLVFQKYGHERELPEKSTQMELKSKAEAVLKTIYAELEHE